MLAAIPGRSCRTRIDARCKQRRQLRPGRPRRAARPRRVCRSSSVGWWTAVPGFEAIVWIDARRTSAPSGSNSAPRRAHGPAGPEKAGVRPRCVTKALASRMSRLPAGSFELAWRSGGPGDSSFPRFCATTGAYAGDRSVGTIRLADRACAISLAGTSLDFWNLEICATARAASRTVLSPGWTNGEPAAHGCTLVDAAVHVPVADLAWKVRLWPTPLLLSATLRTGAAAAHPGHRTAGFARHRRSPISCSPSARLISQAIAPRDRTPRRRRGRHPAASQRDGQRHRCSDLGKRCGRSGRFTFVNDYARKLLGIDTGRNGWSSPRVRWFDHVHPDDRARAHEHLSPAAQFAPARRTRSNTA